MKSKRVTPRKTGPIRLQKFLSDAGIASRRRCEELITEGHVLVNDRIVDTLPAFVHPESDRVTIDGDVVRAQRPEYFLMHKPKDVVCTNRDPAGRTRAVDLLPPMPARLFVVGRLDAESTGLLLLTNDGELAQRVTHPSFGVPKTYRVECKGQLPYEVPQQLREGVYLAEGKARAVDAEITHRSRERTILKITLKEGRNRQIRRMLAKLGYPVKTLKRVQIGPLRLRNLPIGACRRLTGEELDLLRAAVSKAGRGTNANRRGTSRGKPRQTPTEPARERQKAPESTPRRHRGASGRRGRRATPEPTQPKRRIIGDEE